ncbi:MAG: hypothetical protein K2W95_26835 [Candidatus Obscuribacterales bacterium]|nr:hypothetical protein [Candidatus Obscuribacterales bacterium]
MSNPEAQRLEAEKDEKIAWKKWGPYLSERQWGTVREDYSESGNAWESFPHDQARSRAYRWGEDGLAGFSDDKQTLCFALALWNGKDPIIKERLFGLTNGEGNHGEDVKEYYFYLDSTPTHSYMKYLYKYPQQEFPYDKLVAANRYRNRTEFEYELIDTGVFNDDRYFDVFVEYAKAAPEDILIKISVYNRGNEDAALHVLPTLWFRNTWSHKKDAEKPVLKAVAESIGATAVEAFHGKLGERYLYAEGNVPLLFTDNETNRRRIIGQPNTTPYTKDGINNYLTQDRKDAVNPERTGTKVSPHYHLNVPAGGSCVLRLRLTDLQPQNLPADGAVGKQFEEEFALRAQEADQFYESITPKALSEDEATVMRQALAGMLWSKQYYSFNGFEWLKEHGYDPIKGKGPGVRNRDWFHMINDDVVSMPDKWEYPWYAAWDLAFHTLALGMVDLEFAKQQLNLMLNTAYLHPNGQIPAYEWNFGDVNPPVHAWAALFLYYTEKQQRGDGDLQFLRKVFGKLNSNFAWWVNRKDRFGKNVFDGGFLGLDNISVFDRSAPLPTGGNLEQADGTAWMALFCQNMLEIAIELSSYDPVYEEFATKYGEHFIWIAAAVNRQDDGGMWDEEDGFYYDLLRLPGGKSTLLKVRSMVGLLPMCAVTVIEPFQREQIPNTTMHIRERLLQVPEILETVHKTGPDHLGVGGRGIVALVNEERLRRILTKLLDENEFLSPFGIRSLSRYHAQHPFVAHVSGQEFRVDYLPAESNSGLFGGNSNWRGPIWFPVNAIIIRALLQYFAYYGDSFKVEFPTGSGNWLNLFEVARELSNRLSGIFLRSSQGRRAVFGGSEKFQNDPHWRDYVLFYEYFHGDNGAGLGASHQTGWTGIVARLMQLFAGMDAETLLKGGKREVFKHRDKVNVFN